MNTIKMSNEEKLEMLKSTRVKGISLETSEQVEGSYLHIPGINKKTEHFIAYVQDKNLVVTPVSLESIQMYVPVLDAYTEDGLYGEERDEYKQLLASWVGFPMFNPETERVQVFCPDEDSWYEVDDFDFEHVIPAKKCPSDS